MSNFTKCFKKYGHLLSDYEKKAITEAAKEYLADGYDAKTANESAIKDVLQDLEAEREDIINQIRAGVPEGVNVDTILGLKEGVK